MESLSREDRNTIAAEFPKKVELHVHLDASIRHSTIWELLRENGNPLPGNGTYSDLCKALTITEGKNLHNFLAPFDIYTSIYQGNIKVAERIGYEYVEDAYKEGITYAEVRYSPHKCSGEAFYQQYGEQGLEEMVKGFSRGLQKGCEEFKINVKTILVTYPYWPFGNNVANEVLKLCQKFDDVVGLDVCTRQPPEAGLDEAPVTPELTRAFEEARKTGVHTTIHAGEASGPNAINRAKNHYRSDRVGHGYHVVQDEELYSECLRDNVHFECCPYSSLLTGAVPLSIKKHPIARFAEDKANFSLSTDDPTLTAKYLNDDYALAKSFGLTNQHIYQANLNAAEACFLPKFEKDKLIKEIKEAYGFE